MPESPAEQQAEAAALGRLSRKNRRLRRFVYLVLITIAGGLGASSIWRVDPLLSANDRSRWATVRALFENETDPEKNPYQIDDVIADEREHWDTIDKVRHEGHFYSTKPPLLPTLVEGVYEVVNRVTDELDGEPENERVAHKHNGWKLGEETALTTRTILTIVNLIPWLIALAVVAMMAERYSQRDLTRVLLVATAALGTILSTFLVTLNNHITAVISLIFALYPAMRIVIDGERKWWLFALAGFFAAFTCTNELPAALFGLAIFGLLVWKAPKQTLFIFGPCALIPLVGFFYTNWLATGGWKPFYAYYGTEKYEYVHQGVPSYWMQPGGIDANTESPAVYFLHCTIGHHGIFSLTPIFLIAVAGWIGMRWWKNRKLSPFLWMGLGLTLAVIAFYLSRTQNYNYGGNTAGLRWTFWLIPFWLIAMIPALDQLTRAAWFRITAALLLIISIFSATYSLDNPWRPPWLFSLMQRYEWIGDYRTAREPSTFDKTPVATWFSRLPSGDEADPTYWIRFEGTSVGGKKIQLELRDGGTVMQDEKRLRILEVHRSDGGADSTVTRYRIDAESFREGLVVHSFYDGSPDEQDRATALGFLRGLPTNPRPRPYRAYSIGKVDYVFNAKLREGDAFKCYRAASGVRYGPGRGDRYRCDSWLCESVPFGVLQVKYTVTDLNTGEVLSQRFLKAVAVGKIFDDG